MLGKVLVTGGAGCLGSHVVEVLHEKRAELGVREIVVLDVLDRVRWATPEDNARIKGYCSQWIVGSITDSSVVAKAIRECDVVIHVASLIDTGVQNPDLIYEVNVKGTDVILSGCMMEDTVKALVYSSSMDVVVHLSDNQNKDGWDETARYIVDDPKLENDLSDMYAVTKTLAEKRVLKANRRDIDRLRTAAIRPVGLYGERDSVHIGSVLEAAHKMGAMMIFTFGDGSAVFQHVYARNCAWMHILAAKKLVEGNDQVAGQAFFGIDDTKVCNFFDFFQPYIAAKGYKIPTIGIPYGIIYPLAAFTEDVFLLVRKLFPSLLKGVALTFTRRAVQGTCISAWFETDKARRLLGYKPLYSPMESRKRSIEFFARLTDVFPQGPYKYASDEWNYLDDGSDYRPDAPKYLARRRNGNKKSSKILGVLGLVGIGGAIAFGIKNNKNPELNRLVEQIKGLIPQKLSLDF